MSSLMSDEVALVVGVLERLHSSGENRTTHSQGAVPREADSRANFPSTEAQRQGVGGSRECPPEPDVCEFRES